MNRRESLKRLATSMGLLCGGFIWGCSPRSVQAGTAKASPEAIRLAKNGIISPAATPHVVSRHTKVYVDGVLMSGVVEVDVRAGEVTCYIKDGKHWKTRPTGPLVMGLRGYERQLEVVTVVHRGYVHVEAKPNA